MFLVASLGKHSSWQQVRLSGGVSADCVDFSRSVLVPRHFIVGLCTFLYYFMVVLVALSVAGFPSLHLLTAPFQARFPWQLSLIS